MHLDFLNFDLCQLCNLPALFMHVNSGIVSEHMPVFASKQ